MERDKEDVCRTCPKDGSPAPDPAVEPSAPHEVEGHASRDGLGNEVYNVTCFYCGTKLRAPWVGQGIVKCGVCMKLLQIKRPADYCKEGMCEHGRSSRSKGLGGYEDPSQCICERIFFWCPSAAANYLAILLTTFIIGEGFIRVAPKLFPAPDTPTGLLLWGLSVYISINTVANFYWGATTDPGEPPSSEHEPATAGSGGSGEAAKSEDTAKTGNDAESMWCDICEAAKPPDTHHCRRCKRCVYGMDHHCVFLNTCVGEGNHRYFLLFLFWVSLATLYVAVCTFIVARRMLLEKRIDRLDILETMRVEGKLPDMRVLLMSAHGVGGFIATVAMPILALYGDVAGWETVILLIASGTTFVTVFIMLLYHLTLTYRGVSQLQSHFNLQPRRPKPKGLAAVRAALAPRPNGHVSLGAQGWGWLVCCLLPIPPVSKKRRTA